MGGLRDDGENRACLRVRKSLANGSELEANRKLTGCSSARVETAPSRTRELEAEGAHTLFSVAAGRRHNGEVPKRSNGADCKSAGSCLRRFKSSPLHQAGIAQLARARAFQARGRGFESRFPLQKNRDVPAHVAQWQSASLVRTRSAVQPRSWAPDEPVGQTRYWEPRGERSEGSWRRRSSSGRSLT